MLAEAPTIKVWVIGNPAAGKSTVAGAMADQFGVPHIQLDEAFWSADWTPVAEGDFVAVVRQLIDQSGWVVDGQYGAAIRNFVAEADIVVWLDVPLWRSVPRLLRRTLVRAWRGTPLWGGNRETYWHAIGPKSILWYAIAVHRRYRKHNAELFERLAREQTVLVRARQTHSGDVIAHVKSRLGLDEI